MARLEVELGADISGLVKQLSATEKALLSVETRVKATANELKDLTIKSVQNSDNIDKLNSLYDRGKISLDKYNRSLNQLKLTESKISNDTKETQNNLTRLNKQYSTLGGSSGSINKYNKATVNALPATQEFSRVIQDAPFGIQGVGNNLQQLTANFGHLSKQAGGSVNAIKAMIASLSGPAGILLAVSAVTSLLTVYSDEIFNSVGATNKLTEATKEYTSKARAEGIELNTLVSIATNEANSKQVRQKAIDELNKNYGDYLGNLDLENIKTSNLAVNVQKLTAAIVQRAKVEGLKKAITETSADAEEDILNAENRRTEAYKNLNAQIDDAIKKNAFLSQVLGNVTDEKERIKQFIELANKYEDVRNVSQSAIGAVKEYNASIKNSKQVNDELEASLSNLVTAQQRAQKQLFETEASITPADANDVVIIADLSKIKERNEKRLKAEKDAAEKRAKILEQINKDIYASELKDAEQFTKDIIAAFGKTQSDIDPFAGLGDKINSGFSEIVREAEIAKEKTAILNDAISSSFSALANQISSELKTGSAVVDAFVGSIVGSLGKLAAELIASALAEKAIATTKIATNQAVATSAAISAGAQSGAASGPAGFFTTPGFIAALVAVVGAAFAGIQSFATGTKSFSGDNNLAYLNGNEMILRPYEISALYNAIRGTGMSNIANNPISNSVGDGIMGEVVLRGNNQVIQLRRAEKKMGRFYNS